MLGDSRRPAVKYTNTRDPYRTMVGGVLCLDCLLKHVLAGFLQKYQTAYSFAASTRRFLPASVLEKFLCLVFVLLQATQLRAKTLIQ